MFLLKPECFLQKIKELLRKSKRLLRKSEYRLIRRKNIRRWLKRRFLFRRGKCRYYFLFAKKKVSFFSFFLLQVPFFEKKACVRADCGWKSGGGRKIACVKSIAACGDKNIIINFATCRRR
jgi:hypothetical protein